MNDFPFRHIAEIHIRHGDRGGLQAGDRLLRGRLGERLRGENLVDRVQRRLGRMDFRAIHDRQGERLHHPHGNDRDHNIADGVQVHPKHKHQTSNNDQGKCRLNNAGIGDIRATLCAQ